MKLGYRRKVKSSPPLKFTICDTDKIVIVDSMMIVNTSFYNVVLELSPLVINRILKTAISCGFINLSQSKPSKRKKEVW